MVKGPNPDSKLISDKCKAILVDHNGFSWDDPYAGRCVHALLKSSKTSTILTTLHAHLTVAQIDAEPSNVEATRRLLFFANSLFMDIPSAPSIQSMKSFSTLTPFHSEDVLYSFADLEKQTEDGVSVFYYLQTIYPSEWTNFLQRVGVADNRVASILHSRKTMEAREWATNRGQTLGRTIDGMMLYERALRLLAKLEQPTLYDVEIDEMVKQKFQYLVSAQVYGKQKRESDPKSAEIDIYLRKYPNMRVAYIDTLKVPKHDHHGKHTVVDEYYSVLIKAEDGDVKEVYRVQLPGNPILGEGKPENQNQAIIFTRGEYLQTIDMNQSKSHQHSFTQAFALHGHTLLSPPAPRVVSLSVCSVGWRRRSRCGICWRSST
jgi:callose synthase